VVFHLNVHVMPRHAGIALLPPASRREDTHVLQDHAAKLIAALRGAQSQSGHSGPETAGLLTHPVRRSRRLHRPSMLASAARRAPDVAKGMT
jgi:hypothetical protein